MIDEIRKGEERENRFEGLGANAPNAEEILGMGESALLRPGLEDSCGKGARLRLEKWQAKVLPCPV